MSEVDDLMERRARRKKTAEVERDNLDRINRGLIPLGPGHALLPAAYRGSQDFLVLTIYHAVMHNGLPIAAFESTADAEHWLAWHCNETNNPRDAYGIAPVRLMSKRLAGPLFDTALPASERDPSVEREPS